MLSFHIPLLLLLLFLCRVSMLPALPVLPEPDPSPVQLLPSAAASAAASGSTPSATIPAFPEQSDIMSSSCPLQLNADLLPFVSTACSSSGVDLPSRSRCCPALAAWLYDAYSATALAARPLLPSNYEVPALPDDSESCIAAVERELRGRGVDLPHVNWSCDAAYCYCGIRLRRLSCPGGFVAGGADGRWVPSGAGGRQLERDCARPGLAGCSRCLRTLNQLKAKEIKQSANVTESKKKEATSSERECQLMGVTWLLSENHTLYLPAATAVLRAIMAADVAGNADPTVCSLSLDDMPLAVGSAQINGHDGSSAVPSLIPLPLHLLLLILLLYILSFTFVFIY